MSLHPLRNGIGSLAAVLIEGREQRIHAGAGLHRELSFGKTGDQFAVGKQLVHGVFGSRIDLGEAGQDLQLKLPAAPGFAAFFQRALSRQQCALTPIAQRHVGDGEACAGGVDVPAVYSFKISRQRG